MGKESDETYSDAETSRRRDAIVRNMIAMPPKPHQPKAKKKRASPAKPKRRVPSA
jgi:hypothetical protein